MAFRGNCNDNIHRTDFNVEKNYFRSGDEGNFIGLVKLLAGENLTLANHIKKCKENAINGRTKRLTYLSSHFVNKALFIIRKQLVNTIVTEIKRNGGSFGLLMDGSQDITCQEQFSVVVRYVNDTDDIVERTVLFFNSSDTSGASLYAILHILLTQIGLSTSNIIGYSFDGAANMRSVLGSHIKENNADSIYTWCLSHRFNLVLKAATGGLDQIKDVLQLAEESAKLFRGSYVRMDVWKGVVTKTPNISSKVRLKLIGTTRWSSKQEAITNIIKSETHLFVLIKSLLKICSLKNLEKAALVNATHIANSWLKYENIVYTFVLHEVYSLTVHVTKSLQKYGLNVLDAVKSIRALKESLDGGKKMINTYIEEAEKFMKNTNSLLANDEEMTGLGCECCIHFPPADEKQKTNDEIAKDFLKFIEIVENEINSRILLPFDEPGSILNEMRFLDPRVAEKLFSSDFESVTLRKLCTVNNITNESAAINELKNFSSNYLQYVDRPKFVAILNNNNFLNSENESNDYDEEFTNFVFDDESDIQETEADIRNVEFQPLNKKKCFCLECMMKYINQDGERKKEYGNINKIFKFIAILPSTQVKCERDFSKMKLMKNRLRSSLCDKSLENLMIISAEAKMFENIDLNEIINEIIATSTRIASDVHLNK